VEPVTILAGCAGGLIVASILVLIAGLTGRMPAPGTPPRRSFSVSSRSRRRLLLAAGAGIAVLALTRWPVATIAATLAVLFLPRITSGKEARKHAAVLEGLEQWTRRLSDMLTASRGLEDALEASARHAPPAIEPAVTALGRRLAARAPAEQALRAFAAEIADPAGDRIAAALIIATGHRGGAVRDVLNALAAMLARDVAARREIEAERAQHRTTVKWLTLFVLAFTVFAVLNRAYSAPFGTVPGQVVMALVTALYAGGLYWLHHLGSVPSPGRFLTGQPPAMSAVRPGQPGYADMPRAVPSGYRGPG
jgi:Flp pilus assembly protein TadB